MGGALHFTKILWVLIPVTATATSTAAVESVKGEKSLLNGKKISEVLLAKKIKDSKSFNGIKNIVQQVMDKQKLGKVQVKVTKVALKKNNVSQESDEERLWYENILEKLIEEGYKWGDGNIDSLEVGKYYKKKVKNEKKEMFQKINDGTLMIDLDQWLNGKWEKVVKEVIKGCGFYKTSDNWSAGLSGVYKDGVSWKTTNKNNGEKANDENKIEKWFKNECGIKVGGGPISWHSWSDGGSGPIDKLKNQGLTKNGKEWDNQMHSFSKTSEIKIKKQFKESRGVKKFINELLTKELERDLFKENNNSLKIGKEWIDSGNGTLISWQT